MGKVAEKLVLLLCLVILSACSGNHLCADIYFDSEPISPSTDIVVRVPFDQVGRLGPRDSDKLERLYNEINSKKPCSNSNYDSVFRYDGGNHEGYPSTDRYEEASRRIASTLENRGSKSLVILVHGFRNSYEEAKKDLELMRNRIREEQPKHNHVFLEVYWDGLSSVWSFRKALTYSNFAGHVGLRELINKLPEGIAVRAVTHSRGAAVILSMLANPAYDNEIFGTVKEQLHPKDVNVDKLRDFKAVLIAPAVGNGHFLTEKSIMWPRDHRRPSLGETSIPNGTQLFISVNRLDFALNKIIFGSSHFGDTRAGTDISFIKEIKGVFMRNGFQNVINEHIFGEFEEEQYHSLERYLDKRLDMQCLLWGAGLADSKPASCSINSSYPITEELSR